MEERETVFALLGAYLRGKVRTLLFFLISAMAFCLIYALYRLPWGPVLYCGLISFTVVLLFGAADFARFVKRHRHLMTLLGTADLELGFLPEPENRIEADYQQIAKVMDQTRAKIISERDSSREEMERYYTLPLGPSDQDAHRRHAPASRLRRGDGGEKRIGAGAFQNRAVR